MIRFTFKVNNSFLNGGTHPLTVPKTQVDYLKLERDGYVGPATIVTPTGMRMRGQVYSGTAGYGPYYQIRVESKSADPLKRLVLGETLLVEMQRVDGQTVISLAQKGRAV